MTFVRFPRPAAVTVYLVVSGVGSAAFSMYAFIASVYRIVEVGLGPSSWSSSAPCSKWPSSCSRSLPV